MKKILLVSTFMLFLISVVNAQDFLGYANSNYSGVTGTDLNPAAVVDSRYKVDINLIGLSFGVYNNYLGLKRSALDHTGSLIKGTYPAFNDPNFMKNYLEVRESDKNKSVYLSLQLYSPSFLITINKKNAFALKAKMRLLMNIDGVEDELATLIYNELRYPSLWVSQLHNKNFSVQQMSWVEYGATYGHVFTNEGPHFLKAGVTVKYLQGLEAAYMHVKDLNYQFTNDTLLTLFHSQVDYGHSTNFEVPEGGTPAFKKIAKPSFGFDLGVVYEWRPDYEKFKYDMDGKTNLYRKDKNKYKLRVGVSAVDIGSVKFIKGQYSRSFTADIGLWNLNDFGAVGNIQQYDSLLDAKFSATNNKQYFRMNLPTAFSLQVDYNIWKDFYVNFTPYWSPRFKNDNEKVHDITNFSLTPRWDHKWFGVFVPFSYDNTGNTKIGLALRLGPLVVGTNSFGIFATKKNIYGADAYLMLKVPILYSRPKDRDKDGISNRKDKCKDVPGTWEFLGCPDRDLDHIQDKDDACPDEPGTPEFNGCPDRDGDKIIDKKDSCPDDAGLVEFNGCPDKDGDKIMDKEDNCPDEAGLAQFGGCPDRDNDSIMDKEDACPDKFGPASNKGCPETKLNLIDGKGTTLQTVVQNKEDGSFAFATLPSEESAIFNLEGEQTDGITEVKVMVGGVLKRAFRDKIDRYFRFPVVVKPIEPIKPPVVKEVVVQLNKEEEEVLKKAFDNLEFALAKDIIKQESFSSLDELAALMAKKPTWKLKISGHTDNQGKPAVNLKLSEKRAKAVQNYLVSKGLAADRFKAEWFGSKKPIADNKTEAGRQKNRRVEMLIFE
jgi:outer membrane protein OmpA-like peptidoglycan-associated protein